MVNTAQHMEPTKHSGYRLYWVTWITLLIITVIMLAAELVSVPRWILVIGLVSAMLVKAGTIAGNFMHLRYERKGLVLIIALSLAFTAIFLFGYLAADALHTHDHPAYSAAE